VARSTHGLILGTFCRDWGKPQKYSVRIVGSHSGF